MLLIIPKYVDYTFIVCNNQQHKTHLQFIYTIASELEFPNSHRMNSPYPAVQFDFYMFRFGFRSLIIEIPIK